MYKKFQLKNSMNVIFVESRKSPVVSVQLWVKNGSADEKKGEEGLSHFIEHLVFKGTEKFKVGEIAQIVEGSGGELNAYTSFDQTVYYVTISKNFVNVAFDVISEMLGAPLFDADEIDNEREVVLEEIKRTFDSPQRVASRQLFSTLYKKHPYGRPVIGYDKIIKKVSKKKILEFFNKRYTPKNMTLVVTGDFDQGESKKIIRKKFETFDKRNFKNVKRDKEEKQTKPKVNVKSSNFEDDIFSVAWKIPKVTHKDIPALDLISILMGQGESSFLNQKLHFEKNLVNYVSAGTFTPIDQGFLTIQSSVRLEKFEEFLSELLLCLKKLLSEPFELKEFEKAVVNLESEEHYSKETVGGLARKVGTYQFLFDDYKYFVKFMKSVRSLDTLQLFKVARKYLKPETLNISFMTSGDEKLYKKIINKWKKDFANLYLETKPKSYKDIKPLKSKIKLSRVVQKKDVSENIIEKLELESGATLLMRPNYDVPLVSFRAAFLGGLRRERQSNQGITELLARVWDRQTASHTEQELSYNIDSMASSLSSFGGRNTIGLNMTSLSTFSNKMRELFFEMLFEPKFDEDITRREKHIMQEVIRRRKDSPAQLAFLYFMKYMYSEKHPYSRDMYGEDGSINKLNVKMLSEIFNEQVSSKNLYFCITGAFDKKEWIDTINEYSSGFSSGEVIHKEFEFQPPDETLRMDYESDKEQSHIILGFPGLTFTDPRRHTLDVIQSILSGQGGRLFLELRDKASLAYSLSPIKMEGIDAGHFGIYIGCSPEKKEVAIGMIKDELKKLMDTKVSSEELERAKKYIIGKHDIGLQKNSSVSASILFDDIYGIDYKESFKISEKIQRVTAGEIQVFAQQMFSKPELIVSVG